MKTSGIPQQTPATSTSATANKTAKADSKPQKDFKEVLDSDSPKTSTKEKFTGKMPLKGQKAVKEGLDQHSLPGRKGIATKGEKQDPREGVLKKEDLSEGLLRKEELTKKKEKENFDLKEFSIPTHVMMGPAPQPKAEVQKVQGPPLNIKEIESIVQKVQVGMNEKGLPEMNFELMTDKLGALNLKVSSENEKISIQFIAQDNAAQAELQKGINDLSQLLGQRGLNLAEANVMTRDQQSGQQQQRDREDSGLGISTSSPKSKAKKRVATGPSDDGFTI